MKDTNLKEIRFRKALNLDDWRESFDETALLWFCPGAVVKGFGVWVI